jgi:hypothetical protein
LPSAPNTWEGFPKDAYHEQTRFFQGAHRLGRFDLSYPVVFFLLYCEAPVVGTNCTLSTRPKAWMLSGVAGPAGTWPATCHRRTVC